MTMQVKILSISRSSKPSVLASVRLEVALENGDSIIIDDARVLRNRHGQLWLAMPISLVLDTACRLSPRACVLPG